MRTSLLFFIQVLFSIAALVIALYILDLSYLLENLKLISVVSVLGALALNLVSIYLMSWRWFWIEQGIKFSGSSESIFTYFTASIYNLISPGNLGGDVYRFVALKSKSLTTLVLTGKIFRERLVGLGSICLAAFLALLFTPTESFFYPRFYNLFLILTFLLSIAVLTLFFSPSSFFNLINSKNLKESFLNFLSPIHGFKENLVILGISIFAYLIWILSISFIAASLGVDIPFYSLVLVGSLVELIRFIPISVQGIGIREGAFAFFLTSYNLDMETSYLIGLISYTLLSLSLLMVGLTGLLALILRKKTPLDSLE